MDIYNKLFEDIVWWQKWEIAPGIFTPGRNSVDFILSMVDLPKDLSGKRVLDIGTWNGCFSFEAERRGAAEVLAIGPESPIATGFLKLKQHLNSRVEYKPGTIYHLRPDEIGLFDIVLCFGVFYHLRYPMIGLDNLRLICKETLFLETHIIENCVFNPKKNKYSKLQELSKELIDIPLLQFYRANEINNDDSNWFGPNNEAMIQMLKSAGFSVVHSKLDENNRAYYKCSIDLDMPEFLNIKCGENVYYDILLKDIWGPKDIFKK